MALRSKSPEEGEKPVAIKAIRLGLGLTQQQFAVALNSTITTVSRWERGKSEPELTAKQFKLLCRLANLSLEEIPDYLGKAPA